MISSFPTFRLGVLLLAAGASRRMGTCKALLPWHGGKTILEHLLGQWRFLGAAQVAPVVDPSNRPFIEALLHEGFSKGSWIENPLPERGMFSSLQEGSRWPGWHSDLTHWIIAQGDQPCVQTPTLELLLKTASRNPQCLCQPCFHGEAAHPIVLPSKDFRALAGGESTDLRSFLRQRSIRRLKVAVPDPGILANLNTPEEYESWRAKSDHVRHARR